VSFVVGFIFWQTLVFFGLSLWMILLLMPVMAYAQMISANQFSFRNSLEFQPIPETGYEKRIVVLSLNEQILGNLGFRKTDEFYLQTSTDIIFFVYRHEQYPITFCDYHFGGDKQFSDLITKFDNEYSLTTSNSKYGGVIKREKENLLQNFESRPFHELLNQHMQAGKFLCEQNLRVKNLQSENFRQWFMDGFKKEGKKLRKPYMPLKIMYGMATNYRQRYAKPIEQQFLAKMLQLS
jgi:hypothetical protein